MTTTQSVDPSQPVDFAIDAATRTHIIEGALTQLEAQYVFPETGAEMARALRQRLAGGEYNTITTAADLCAALTTQMREISHDKHLEIFFRDQPLVAEDPESVRRNTEAYLT